MKYLRIVLDSKQKQTRFAKLVRNGEEICENSELVVGSDEKDI